MRKSEVYFIYKSLVNAFNLIKSGKLDDAQLRSFCEIEIKKLLESLPLIGRPIGADTFELVLNNAHDPDYLDFYLAFFETAITKLALIEPDLIFLLTAPFDEDAKTGDGQYALSLEEGLGQHSKSECIWLKEYKYHNPKVKHSYYRISIENHLKPIPKNCIPTVYVLQQVANEKTVLSGYQLSKKSDPIKALEKIKEQVTFRTPKILTNTKNQIVALGLYLDSGTQIFNKETLIAELSSIKTKLEESSNDLFSIRYNYLETVLNQFHPNSYNEQALLDCLKKLSSSTIQEGVKVNFKEDFAVIFKQAYTIAQNDSDRKFTIKHIMYQVQQRGAGKKCAIDIHIRPPDTGAFITPRDIKKFKKLGLVVNITVHEYKQNYTRPHLQLLTHELLQQADSVLFFNDKERKNATNAANLGQIDSKRIGNWPFQQYDLSKKTGLTVASQVLSGENNLLPEEVLKKKPNLLCFGTIRPNKGFDIAIQLAQLIKEYVSSARPMICIPTVIVGGDPQYTNLIENMCNERFGDSVFKEYKLNNPYTFDETSVDSSQMKRAYWKKAIPTLDENTPILHNPYLKIIPWIDDLEAFKSQGKYFLRFDDMGMRNNGSGIISVLNGGIVYTKWGTVTDKEYQPQNRHGQAIILTPEKYGNYNKDNCKDDYEKKFKVKNPLSFLDFYTTYESRKKIESNYKRKENFIAPDFILNVLLDREADELTHATNIKLSQNYQTVLAAQMLLRTKFSLENSVLCLMNAILPKMQKAKTIEKLEQQEISATPQTKVNGAAFFTAAPGDVIEDGSCNANGLVHVGDSSTDLKLSQNGVV